MFFMLSSVGFNAGLDLNTYQRFNVWSGIFLALNVYKDIVMRQI